MTASSTRTKKAKGKSFQNDIRDEILKLFPHLTTNDVYSTSMGSQGIDIKLSPEARKVFPYAVECKRSESININKAFEQSKTNGDKEGLIPIVVSKQNYKDSLVTLEWEVFKEMLKRLYRVEFGNTDCYGVELNGT